MFRDHHTIPYYQPQLPRSTHTHILSIIPSAMTSTAPSTKPGFLDLPAELRNDIHQLALTNNNPLFVEVNWPRGRVLLSASASVDIDSAK